jgi:hypothetical protein
MLSIEVGQNEEGLSGYEYGPIGQMGRIAQADNLAPTEIDGERFDGSQLRIIHRPPPFTAFDCRSIAEGYGLWLRAVSESAAACYGSIIRGFLCIED